MFIHNINPVLFSIGPFEMRYYGLIFVLGLIIAYFLFAYLARRKKIKLSENDIANLFLYGIIGIILGSRIFYVVVYNLPYYLANPFEIIAVWHGGLSFHGGLIGAILAIAYFCKKRKIDFYEITDIAVIPLALGLALGRIGNFINGELYGRITGVPWAVKFPDEPGFRHPSQIYESLKNFFIFFTLWLIKDKKLPKGFLSWLFVVMYSALRFIIEFFRMPDEQIGFIIGLTMGQILSIIMFFIGLWFMYRVYKKK